MLFLCFSYVRDLTNVKIEKNSYLKMFFTNRYLLLTMKFVFFWEKCSLKNFVPTRLDPIGWERSVGGGAKSIL